jgi:hypothetical protein
VAAVLAKISQKRTTPSTSDFVNSVLSAPDLADAASAYAGHVRNEDYRSSMPTVAAKGVAEEPFALTGAATLGSRGRPGGTDLDVVDAVRNEQRQRTLRDRSVRLEAALFEEHGRTIDAGSARGLRFLVASELSVPVPSISADSSGRVIATWRLDQRQALTVRLISDEQLEFAMSRWSLVAIQPTLLREWGNGSTRAFFAENAAALEFARRLSP